MADTPVTERTALKEWTVLVDAAARGDVIAIKRYQGCVSWVELGEGIDVSAATPVLDDASLMTRVTRLQNALG